MKIDAIEQRPGNARLVIGCAAQRATASERRVRKVPAATWVHCRNELSTSRKRDMGVRPRDTDITGFERLPQGIQHGTLELGQFVEKQRAEMREADFAGPHPEAADFPVARRHRPSAARRRTASGLRRRPCMATSHRMITRDQWRKFIDHPVVEWSMFGIGLVLLALAPIVGALPGPGGIIVAGIGLALVLRTSMWAKRHYVRFKRWQPKAGRWTDWALRRKSAKRREEIRKAEKDQAQLPETGGAS